MQSNDFEAFREGLAGVLSFYDKAVSAFVLDAWWAAMKRYELAEVVDAFNRHLANPDKGHFTPRPADITAMLQGSSQDGALRAWAKVDRALREKGPYRDVVFDDPLIHRVLTDMGGWVALSKKGDDEWPFVAKEFENRYRGFSVRSETPEYPRKLIGLITAENGKKGFKGDEPVLIGDPQKAMRVMSGGSDRPALQFRQFNESDMPVPAPQLRQVG
jgi:hypothetical protein